MTNRTFLLMLPALLALAIGFILPMGSVVWTSLHQGGLFSTGAWAEVLSSRTFLGILSRTFTMAAVVTLLTLSVAYPLAYWAATAARRWSGQIMALVAVPYLTSILIRSYAWVAILGGNGLVNRALEAAGLIDEPLPLVFNRFGSYVGMVHILLPMAVFPIFAAMQRIDPALMRAGASLGAPPGSAFATIFLPLSWPGVSAGAALVFLAAMGFYITPALLGAPGDYLVAQAIEVRVSTLAEFDTAAAQACLLLALVTALMLLLRRRIVAMAGEETSAAPARRLPMPPVLRRAAATVAAVLAPVATPLLWAYGLLLLTLLLAPMIVVVLIAFSSAPYLSFPPPGWSLRWFFSFFEDRAWLAATGFSLVVSLAGAATALAIGTPFALALSRGRFKRRRLLWLLAVAPIDPAAYRARPGPVLHRGAARAERHAGQLLDRLYCHRPALCRHYPGGRAPPV
ncbi:hypothetical protein BKE38_06915 [Pseudoroseomonas deserti]|uniref:ABC transmembrane type-1 domain-containing protein n=1 Tax=Teichococcus deserti TaxID=1817963 RepID=A0A1V2H525_9PROT|nr:hypothetical protein [Pseudoroseomonas deserti]ONG56055.1 hypothetical protein BKE38_06915 [Pseudoroseomonas deserti]